MVTRPHDISTSAGAAGAPGVRMFHNLANRVLGTFRGPTVEPDMNIFVTRDVVRMRDGSMSLAGSSAATWAFTPAPRRSARRNAMAAPPGTAWVDEEQWEQENVGPRGVARARAQTLAKLTGQTIDPLTSTSTGASAAHLRARSTHRPSVPDLRTLARGELDLDFDPTPKNRRARDTLQTSYTTDSIDTSASAMWRRRQRVQSESGSAPTSLVGPWQQARPTYFGHERVAAESFTVGFGDIDEDEEDDYDEIPFVADETPLPVRDSLPHSVASTYGSLSRSSSSGEGTSTGRGSGEATSTGRRERVPPPPSQPPRDWRRENEVLRLAGLSGAPSLQLHRSASFGNGRVGVHPSGHAGGAAAGRGPPTGRRVLGVVNQTTQPQASQQRNVYGSHPRPVDTINSNGHARPSLYEDPYDQRRRSRPERVTSMTSNAAVAYFPLG